MDANPLKLETIVPGQPELGYEGDEKEREKSPLLKSLTGQFGLPEPPKPPAPADSFSALPSDTSPLEEDDDVDEADFTVEPVRPVFQNVRNYDEFREKFPEITTGRQLADFLADDAYSRLSQKTSLSQRHLRALFEAVAAQESGFRADARAVAQTSKGPRVHLGLFQAGTHLFPSGANQNDYYVQAKVGAGYLERNIELFSQYLSDPDDIAIAAVAAHHAGPGPVLKRIQRGARGMAIASTNTVDRAISRRLGRTYTTNDYVRSVFRQYEQLIGDVPDVQTPADAPSVLTESGVVPPDIESELKPSDSELQAAAESALRSKKDEQAIIYKATTADGKDVFIQAYPFEIENFAKENNLQNVRPFRHSITNLSYDKAYFQVDESLLRSDSNLRKMPVMLENREATLGELIDDLDRMGRDFNQYVSEQGYEWFVANKSQIANVINQLEDYQEKLVAAYLSAQDAIERADSVSKVDFALRQILDGRNIPSDVALSQADIKSITDYVIKAYKTEDERAKAFDRLYNARRSALAGAVSKAERIAASATKNDKDPLGVSIRDIDAVSAGVYAAGWETAANASRDEMIRQLNSVGVMVSSEDPKAVSSAYLKQLQGPNRRLLDPDAVLRSGITAVPVDFIPVMFSFSGEQYDDTAAIATYADTFRGLFSKYGSARYKEEYQRYLERYKAGVPAAISLANISQADIPLIDMARGVIRAIANLAPGGATSYLPTDVRLSKGATPFEYRLRYLVASGREKQQIAEDFAYQVQEYILSKMSGADVSTVRRFIEMTGWQWGVGSNLVDAATAGAQLLDQVGIVGSRAGIVIPQQASAMFINQIMRLYDLEQSGASVEERVAERQKVVAEIQSRARSLANPSGALKFKRFLSQLAPHVRLPEFGIDWVKELERARPKVFEVFTADDDKSFILNYWKNKGYTDQALNDYFGDQEPFLYTMAGEKIPVSLLSRYRDGKKIILPPLESRLPVRDDKRLQQPDPSRFHLETSEGVRGYASDLYTIELANAGFSINRDIQEYIRERGADLLQIDPLTGKRRTIRDITDEYKRNGRVSVVMPYAAIAAAQAREAAIKHKDAQANLPMLPVVDELLGVDTRPEATVRRLGAFGAGFLQGAVTGLDSTGISAVTRIIANQIATQSYNDAIAFASLARFNPATFGMGQADAVRFQMAQEAGMFAGAMTGAIAESLAAGQFARLISPVFAVPILSGISRGIGYVSSGISRITGSAMTADWLASVPAFSRVVASARRIQSLPTIIEGNAFSRFIRSQFDSTAPLWMVDDTARIMTANILSQGVLGGIREMAFPDGYVYSHKEGNYVPAVYEPGVGLRERTVQDVLKDSLSMGFANAALAYFQGLSPSLYRTTWTEFIYGAFEGLYKNKDPLASGLQNVLEELVADQAMGALLRRNLPLRLYRTVGADGVTRYAGLFPQENGQIAIREISEKDFQKYDKLRKKKPIFGGISAQVIDVGNRAFQGILTGRLTSDIGRTQVEIVPVSSAKLEPIVGDDTLVSDFDVAARTFARREDVSRRLSISSTQIGADEIDVAVGRIQPSADELNVDFSDDVRRVGYERALAEREAFLRDVAPGDVFSYAEQAYLVTVDTATNSLVAVAIDENGRFQPNFSKSNPPVIPIYVQNKNGDREFVGDKNFSLREIRAYSAEEANSYLEKIAALMAKKKESKLTKDQIRERFDALRKILVEADDFTKREDVLENIKKLLIQDGFTEEEAIAKAEEITPKVDQFTPNLVRETQAKALQIIGGRYGADGRDAYRDVVMDRYQNAPTLKPSEASAMQMRIRRELEDFADQIQALPWMKDSAKNLITEELNRRLKEVGSVKRGSELMQFLRESDAYLRALYELANPTVGAFSGKSSQYQRFLNDSFKRMLEPRYKYLVDLLREARRLFAESEAYYIKMADILNEYTAISLANQVQVDEIRQRLQSEDPVQVVEAYYDLQLLEVQQAIAEIVRSINSLKQERKYLENADKQNLQMDEIRLRLARQEVARLQEAKRRAVAQARRNVAKLERAQEALRRQQERDKDKQERDAEKQFQKFLRDAAKKFTDMVDAARRKAIKKVKNRTSAGIKNLNSKLETKIRAYRQLLEEYRNVASTFITDYNIADDVFQSILSGETDYKPSDQRAEELFNQVKVLHAALEAEQQEIFDIAEQLRETIGFGTIKFETQYGRLASLVGGMLSRISGLANRIYAMKSLKGETSIALAEAEAVEIIYNQLESVRESARKVFLYQLERLSTYLRQHVEISGDYASLLGQINEIDVSKPESFNILATVFSRENLKRLKQFDPYIHKLAVDIEATRLALVDIEDRITILLDNINPAIKAAITGNEVPQESSNQEQPDSTAASGGDVTPPAAAPPGDLPVPETDILRVLWAMFYRSPIFRTFDYGMMFRTGKRNKKILRRISDQRKIDREKGLITDGKNPDYYDLSAYITEIIRDDDFGYITYKDVIDYYKSQNLDIDEKEFLKYLNFVVIDAGQPRFASQLQPLVEIASAQIQKKKSEGLLAQKPLPISIASKRQPIPLAFAVMATRTDEKGELYYLLRLTSINEPYDINEDDIVNATPISPTSTWISAKALFGGETATTQKSTVVSVSFRHFYPRNGHVFSFNLGEGGYANYRVIAIENEEAVLTPVDESGVPLLNFYTRKDRPENIRVSYGQLLRAFRDKEPGILFRPDISASQRSVFIENILSSFFGTGTIPASSVIKDKQMYEAAIIGIRDLAEKKLINLNGKSPAEFLAEIPWDIADVSLPAMIAEVASDMVSFRNRSPEDLLKQEKIPYRPFDTVIRYPVPRAYPSPIPGDLIYVKGAQKSKDTDSPKDTTISSMTLPSSVSTSQLFYVEHAPTPKGTIIARRVLSPNDPDYTKAEKKRTRFGDIVALGDWVYIKRRDVDYVVYDPSSTSTYTEIVKSFFVQVANVKPNIVSGDLRKSIKAFLDQRKRAESKPSTKADSSENKETSTSTPDLPVPTGQKLSDLPSVNEKKVAIYKAFHNLIEKARKGESTNQAADGLFLTTFKDFFSLYKTMSNRLNGVRNRIIKAMASSAEGTGDTLRDFLFRLPYTPIHYSRIENLDQVIDDHYFETAAYSYVTPPLYALAVATGDLGFSFGMQTPSFSYYGHPKITNPQEAARYIEKINDYINRYNNVFTSKLTDLQKHLLTIQSVISTTNNEKEINETQYLIDKINAYIADAANISNINPKPDYFAELLVIIRQVVAKVRAYNPGETSAAENLSYLAISSGVMAHQMFSFYTKLHDIATKAGFSSLLQVLEMFPDPNKEDTVQPSTSQGLIETQGKTPNPDKLVKDISAFVSKVWNVIKEKNLQMGEAQIAAHGLGSHPIFVHMPLYPFLGNFIFAHEMGHAIFATLIGNYSEKTFLSKDEVILYNVAKIGPNDGKEFREKVYDFFIENLPVDVNKSMIPNNSEAFWLVFNETISQLFEYDAKGVLPYFKPKVLPDGVDEKLYFDFMVTMVNALAAAYLEKMPDVLFDYITSQPDNQTVEGFAGYIAEQISGIMSKVFSKTQVDIVMKRWLGDPAFRPFERNEILQRAFNRRFGDPASNPETNLITKKAREITSKWREAKDELRNLKPYQVKVIDDTAYVGKYIMRLIAANRIIRDGAANVIASQISLTEDEVRSLVDSITGISDQLSDIDVVLLDHMDTLPDDSDEKLFWEQFFTNESTRNTVLRGLLNLLDATNSGARSITVVTSPNNKVTELDIISLREKIKHTSKIEKISKDIETAVNNLPSEMRKKLSRFAVSKTTFLEKVGAIPGVTIKNTAKKASYFDLLADFLLVSLYEGESKFFSISGEVDNALLLESITMGVQSLVEIGAHVKVFENKKEGVSHSDVQFFFPQTVTSVAESIFNEIGQPLLRAYEEGVHEYRRKPVTQDDRAIIEGKKRERDQRRVTSDVSGTQSADTTREGRLTGKTKGVFGKIERRIRIDYSPLATSAGRIAFVENIYNLSPDVAASFSSDILDALIDVALYSFGEKIFEPGTDLSVSPYAVALMAAYGVPVTIDDFALFAASLRNAIDSFIPEDASITSILEDNDVYRRRRLDLLAQDVFSDQTNPRFIKPRLVENFDVPKDISTSANPLVIDDTFIEDVEVIIRSLVNSAPGGVRFEYIFDPVIAAKDYIENGILTFSMIPGIKAGDLTEKIIKLDDGHYVPLNVALDMIIFYYGTVLLPPSKNLPTDKNIVGSTRIAEIGRVAALAPMFRDPENFFALWLTNLVRIPAFYNPKSFYKSQEKKKKKQAIAQEIPVNAIPNDLLEKLREGKQFSTRGYTFYLDTEYASQIIDELGDAVYVGGIEVFPDVNGGMRRYVKVVTEAVEDVYAYLSQSVKNIPDRRQMSFVYLVDDRFARVTQYGNDFYVMNTAENINEATEKDYTIVPALPESTVRLVKKGDTYTIISQNTLTDSETFTYTGVLVNIDDLSLSPDQLKKEAIKLFAAGYVTPNGEVVFVIDDPELKPDTTRLDSRKIEKPLVYTGNWQFMPTDRDDLPGVLRGDYSYIPKNLFDELVRVSESETSAVDYLIRQGIQFIETVSDGNVYYKPVEAFIPGNEMFAPAGAILGGFEGFVAPVTRKIKFGAYQFYPSFDMVPPNQRVYPINAKLLRTTLAGDLLVKDPLIARAILSESGIAGVITEDGKIILFQKPSVDPVVRKEPKPAREKKGGAIPTEPAPTEQTPTEPAPTEQTPTEPAPTEQTPTEPAPTELTTTKPTPSVTEADKPVQFKSKFRAPISVLNQMLDEGVMQSPALIPSPILTAILNKIEPIPHPSRMVRFFGNNINAPTLVRLVISDAGSPVFVLAKSPEEATHIVVGNFLDTSLFTLSDVNRDAFYNAYSYTIRANLQEGDAPMVRFSGDSAFTDEVGLINFSPFDPEKHKVYQYFDPSRRTMVTVGITSGRQIKSVPPNLGVLFNNFVADFIKKNIKDSVSLRLFIEEMNTIIEPQGRGGVVRLQWLLEEVLRQKSAITGTVDDFGSFGVNLAEWLVKTYRPNETVEIKLATDKNVVQQESLRQAGRIQIDSVMSLAERKRFFEEFFGITNPSDERLYPAKFGDDKAFLTIRLGLRSKDKLPKWLMSLVQTTEAGQRLVDVIYSNESLSEAVIQLAGVEENGKKRLTRLRIFPSFDPHSGIYIPIHHVPTEGLDFDTISRQFVLFLKDLESRIGKYESLKDKSFFDVFREGLDFFVANEDFALIIAPNSNPNIKAVAFFNALSNIIEKISKRDKRKKPEKQPKPSAFSLETLPSEESLVPSISAFPVPNDSDDLTSQVPFFNSKEDTEDQDELQEPTEREKFEADIESAGLYAFGDEYRRMVYIQSLLNTVAERYKTSGIYDDSVKEFIAAARHHLMTASTIDEFQAVVDQVLKKVGIDNPIDVPQVMLTMMTGSLLATINFISDTISTTLNLGLETGARLMASQFERATGGEQSFGYNLPLIVKAIRKGLSEGKKSLREIMNPNNLFIDPQGGDVFLPASTSSFRFFGSKRLGFITKHAFVAGAAMIRARYALSDSITYAIALNLALHEEAYLANLNGFDPRSVDEILNHPPDWIVSRAEKKAKFATFREDNAISSMVGALLSKPKTTTGQVAARFAFIAFITPFFRITTNVYVRNALWTMGAGLLPLFADKRFYSLISVPFVKMYETLVNNQEMTEDGDVHENSVFLRALRDRLDEFDDEEKFKYLMALIYAIIGWTTAGISYPLIRSGHLIVGSPVASMQERLAQTLRMVGSGDVNFMGTIFRAKNNFPIFYFPMGVSQIIATASRETERLKIKNQDPILGDAEAIGYGLARFLAINAPVLGDVYRYYVDPVEQVSQKVANLFAPVPGIVTDMMAAMNPHRKYLYSTEPGGFSRLIDQTQRKMLYKFTGGYSLPPLPKLGGGYMPYSTENFSFPARLVSVVDPFRFKFEVMDSRNAPVYGWLTSIGAAPELTKPIQVSGEMETAEETVKRQEAIQSYAMQILTDLYYSDTFRPKKANFFDAIVFRLPSGRQNGIVEVVAEKAKTAMARAVRDELSVESYRNVLLDAIARGAADAAIYEYERSTDINKLSEDERRAFNELRGKTTKLAQDFQRKVGIKVYRVGVNAFSKQADAAPSEIDYEKVYMAMKRYVAARIKADANLMKAKQNISQGTQPIEKFVERMKK